MDKLEWNLQEIFENNEAFYDSIDNVKQLLEDIKKYESINLNPEVLLKILDEK